jgi:hypothetical protein
MKETKRKTIVLVILLALALILLALAVVRMEKIKASLPDMYAAERAGESGGRFAQVGVFFAANETVTDFDVLYYNESIVTALKSSGVPKEELEGGISYAFSNQAKLTVKSARGYFEVPAIGTGGSFFDFHPYTLLYGDYAQDDSGRGVVLSDAAAWKLFGAVDVEGLTLSIQGEEYVVTGVVKLEGGKAVREALGDVDSVIFVPYLTIGETVSCYEAVLPEPVKGNAERIINGVYAGSAVKQVDTGRFSALNILRLTGRLPAAGMSKSPVEYPFWENAARSAQIRLALWTLFILAWIAPALVIILAFLCPALVRKVKTDISRPKNKG